MSRRKNSPDDLEARSEHLLDDLPAEEELLHRLDQQAAVAELGMRALEWGPLQDLLDAAAKAVSEALRVEFSKILQLRSDQQTLLLRSGMGWNDKRVGHALVSADADSQAGYTLLSASPVIVEDASSEDRFKAAPLLQEHNVLSGISVLIQCREEPWGVLGAHSSNLRRFTNADVRFLQSVAHILSSAIERLETKRFLEASEARNRAIVENVIDGIITIDSHGIIQALNHSVLRIFGYRREELLGRNVSRLMPAQEAERHDGYMRAYLETGQAQIIGVGREVVGQRKDGSKFPMHLGVSELVLQDDRIFVGVIRDLTQEKALQDELMQAQNLASLGEMAASVAHEIKNPLAAVSGVIQILKDNNAVAPPYDEIFSELTDRIGLLDDTVKRLLLFAKPWQPQPQAIDLRELLEHVVESASDQEAFSDVEMRLKVPRPVPASVDIVLFEDVLWNLLYNATEAMPKGGTITVEAEADPEGGAWVRVIDRGTGIPQELLSKLFRPFFTTKAKGTGLGLAICRKIMRLHSGTISADSKEGEGTKVELFLPGKAG